MVAGTQTTFRFESGVQRTSEAQRDRRPHHDRPTSQQRSDQQEQHQRSQRVASVFGQELWQVLAELARSKPRNQNWDC